jgi:hypothetical protein
MTEVMIDGVRYVPAKPAPNQIMFYFMHDNHAFTKLEGKTLKQVLKHADEVESDEWGSYGALCPAILMHDDKEIRRVGTMAHAGSSKAPKDKWEEGKAKWLKELQADPDVKRIMKGKK